VLTAEETAAPSAAVTVTDAAGNRSAPSNVVTVRIDKTAPTTTIHLAGTAGQNGWFTSTVSVTLSATDNLSGVAATEYRIDGGAWTPYTPFTLSNGIHAVDYRSTDNAGNVETFQTQQVKVDTAAPVVTLTERPPDHNGWYDQPVAFNVTATDVGGSAVISQTPNFTYNGPDGSRETVTATATDAAGNVGTASYTFEYDATAPTISGSPDRAPNANGWYSADVTVGFTAGDATSGVAAVTQPVTLHQGAGQSVTGTATDAAGNSSSAPVSGIDIDETAPTTTVSLDRLAASTGWFNGSTGAPAFTLSAADQAGLSGVDHTYYAIDGGSPAVYTGPVAVPEGVHTITFWSVDKAGNIEGHTDSAHQLTVKVDTVAPTLSAAINAPAGTGWYNLATGPAVVTYTATDATSGVTTPAPYTFGEGADQSLAAVTVTDAAGNTSAPAVAFAHVNVDLTPPTVSAAPTISPNGAGWYNQNVTVHFTAADALSGVAAPADQVLTAEGAAVASTAVTVTDAAGNLSAPSNVVTVRIDKTAPTTTASVAGTTDSSGSYYDSATVTLSAGDNLSGIRATYYTIDAGAQQTYQGAFIVTGVGSHTVTFWSVDNAGNAETAHARTISIVANPAASTTTTISAPDSAYATVATVTVTVTSTAATPTGSVTLTVDGQSLAAKTLTNGTAAFSVAGLSVGSHVLSASYTSQGNFAASSQTGALTVFVPSDAGYILNSTASGAVRASGSATIQLGNGLFVDSTSATAVVASGSAKVQAGGSLMVAGGVSASGSAAASPTGAPAATGDPFVNLPMPSPAGLTNYGAVSVSGSTSKSLPAGIYTSITVSGSAHVTLGGTYIIKGGGLTVSGNASLTGSGVVIFNASSTYDGTNDNGAFAAITLGGSGTVNLSAPTAGTYSGVLIFQSRSNPKVINISGSTNMTTSGAIYAAGAQLAIGGSGTLHDTLVVNTLYASGSAGAFQLSDGTTSDYLVSASNMLVDPVLTVAVQDDTGTGLDPNAVAELTASMNYLNTALSQFGVNLSWAPAGTSADVHIHFASTTPEGGAADGVLGFTTAGNDVYFASGWNLYTASDAAGITSGQYDFLTLATHELAHTLGLGESADPNSVMYEYLAAGTTRRTFTDANLQLINTDADRFMKAAPESAASPTSRTISMRSLAAAVLQAAVPPQVAAPVDLTVSPAVPLTSALAFPAVAPLSNPTTGGVTQSGSADDVLLGGAGDDLHFGQVGRDVLVGGFVNHGLSADDAVTTDPLANAESADGTIAGLADGDPLVADGHAANVE
jgi:hypothetical protein